jgi:hypothetical protein
MNAAVCREVICGPLSEIASRTGTWSPSGMAP